MGDNNEPGEGDQLEEHDESAFIRSNLMNRTPVKARGGIDEEEQANLMVLEFSAEIASSPEDRRTAEEKLLSTPRFLAASKLQERLDEFRTPMTSMKRKRENGDRDLSILLEHITRLTVAVMDEKDKLPESIRALATSVGREALRIRREEGEKMMGVDTGTQTLSPRVLKELSEAEKIRHMVKEANTDEKVADLTAMKWPQSVYSVSKTERRSLLNATGTRVLLIDPADTEAKGKIIGLCSQFPSLKKVLERKLEAGLVATIKREDIVVYDDAQEPTTDNDKLLVGVISKGVTCIPTCLRILERVKRCRENGEVVTVAAYGTPIGHLRKLVECVFKGEESPILVCEEKPKRDGTRTLPRERTNEVHNKGRKRTAVETILVSQEGKTFAQVLKDIRPTMASIEGETEILAIKKENENSARIVLKKSLDDGYKKVQQVIRQAHPEISTMKKFPKVVLLIRGLDAEVSKEEVTAAVEREVGDGWRGATVRSMRNTAGETKTASVEVPENVVPQITKGRRIRVGPVWASVTVSKTTQIERCFRCWTMGHLAWNCKGPNRLSMCYKCGESGHKVADCQNDQKCLDCGKGDHRTSSAACGKTRSQRGGIPEEYNR